MKEDSSIPGKKSVIMVADINKMKEINEAYDAIIKGSLEARSYKNSEKKPKKNGAPSLYERRTLGEMPIGIAAYNGTYNYSASYDNRDN